MTVLRQGLERQPTPQDVLTERVRNIPRSLRSFQPSGLEKCKLEGQCRMCERPWHVRPATRHHVVPLAWWHQIALPYREWRNANSNIIPLCRPCHDLIEHRDREIKDESRRMLRRRMGQNEIAFAIACLNQRVFNRAYPT